MKKITMVCMMLSFILMTGMAFHLLGEDLAKVVDEAELYIKGTYKGERARKIAEQKLDKILDDQQKTEEEKIDAIRDEFLKPKLENEIVKTNNPITEANAYQLIWIPPLSWNVHSIAIAYDLEQSHTHIISGETVDTKKSSHIESNENGRKTARGKSAELGSSLRSGMSWENWLKINPRIETETHISYKRNWDQSKTELWSKSRQEQLSNNFEELTKDIRSTQVTRCHLTFAIDFYNNCDEDLEFPANSTVIVKGGTTVLNALPENIGHLETFTIPSGEKKNFKFRAEINTTQAYSLLEFMKTNSPIISPEEGQFNISSKNGKVKDAIKKSLPEHEYSTIRCGAYEWKVRNKWNGRRVMLREALGAINALCKQIPFDIEGDKCMAMCGEICGPHPSMAKAEVYPIAEIDGRFFSILQKEQLDRELPVTVVRFYMDSLEAYVDSESVSQELYAVLLKDLLSVKHEDRSGEVQFLLGKMYSKGKGTTKDEAEAFKWLSKAAEQRNAKAQYKLGRCYDRGEGVPKDMSKAVEWYRKAAEQGDADAQFCLGCCYAKGEGIAKDITKAVEWYRKAAEQGDVDAQFNLGLCYDRGEGVPKDMSKAVEWYRKAAEQGDAQAQFNLGWCYDSGEGVVKDMSKAVEWYRKAAEQEHAIAQNNLGWCYDNGEGIAKDEVKAVEWYRKAAAQGYDRAQYHLGYCYYNGEGIAKDEAKAVEWFSKAAEQGDADAQFCLGLCYKHGKGVVKDMSKAVEWYRKAADQGDTRSQNNLGWCYESGEGITKDMSKAVEWYSKAAEQGDAYAQYNLGRCYDRGEGVHEDMSKAIEWYRKAANQGHESASKRLQEMGQDSSFNGKISLPGGVEIKLVRIKAGSFMMGSSHSEEGRRWWDEDQHKVTLTRDYWLGETEVTQEQWMAVMGNNPSYSKKGGKYPVEQVTWYDAVSFCQKLNSMLEGKLPKQYQFNLPTEAQWEYACRAGTNTPFNFGSTLNGDKANCNGNKPYGMGKGTNLGNTIQVASYKPNAWGLFDMHGNVAEWCRDWHENGYADDPEFLHGQMKNDLRVYRGGSFDSSAERCRSAFRGSFYGNPTTDLDSIGFRVALVFVQ